MQFLKSISLYLLLFFVSSLYLPNGLKAQNWLHPTPLSPGLLSAEQETKFHLWQNDSSYMAQWLVQVHPIHLIEQDESFPLILPDVTDTLWVKRDLLEAQSLQTFWWEVHLPEDQGDLIVNATARGTFGRINYEDDIYLLEALDSTYSVLMKVDTSDFTSNVCGSISPPSEHTTTPTENEAPCEFLPIRIGVLYTQKAKDTGKDMENVALIGVRDLNKTLDNSYVAESVARFTLAGVELLEGFNESIFPCDDAIDMRTNLFAQSFRNDPEILADIIVLLTNGNYGSSYGCVGNDSLAIGGNANTAFAVVQVNKANSKYTFGHEVVHVIGGRHQQSSVYPDGDNTPGYAHGWNWKPNFFSKRRTTLMHVLKGKWKRQRELSNPSVHGREDLNDNARMMRENACRVAGFVDASPMEASMTGPFTLPLYSSGTWCAEVKFCNDVTVNWEYSTDGWNYYFAGTGICITRYIFTAQLHLRATVNCSTGETLTLYRTVRLPEDGANLNRSSSLVSSVLSSTIPSPKWHVFPNPSTSILNIHYLSTKFARAEIWLTDMMGRKRQLHHAVDQKGPIQLSFSTNHYAAGIYLLTLIDGHETFKQTIIIQAP